MYHEIPQDGLPAIDRWRLKLAHWLLAGLSPQGAIRWKWHLLREKAG